MVVSNAPFRAWVPILGVMVVLVACRSETPPAGAPSTRRPAAAVRGLDADGTMHPGPADRCPVCGMEVPDAPAALELAGGRTYYFCGNACLVRAWLHPEAVLGAAPAERGRAVVRDAAGSGTLDAARAVFVAGSDVPGSMGMALVALDGDEAARAFVREHGGAASFRLADLDEAGWNAIVGRAAVPVGGSPGLQ